MSLKKLMAAGAIVVVGMGAVNTLATSNQMVEGSKADQDPITQMDKDFMAEFDVTGGSILPSDTVDQPHERAQKEFLNALAQEGYTLRPSYNHDEGTYNRHNVIKTAENSADCNAGDVKLTAKTMDFEKGYVEASACVTPNNTTYKMSFKDMDLSDNFNQPASKGADMAPAAVKKQNDSCQGYKEKMRAKGVRITATCA